MTEMLKGVAQMIMGKGKVPYSMSLSTEAQPSSTS